MGSHSGYHQKPNSVSELLHNYVKLYCNLFGCLFTRCSFKRAAWIFPQSAQIAKQAWLPYL